MNETSNLQLFISLSVSHHPGCHTQCALTLQDDGAAAPFRWSTRNIQAQTRNYGARVRKCLLSRFTWTPKSSQASINWQHQHSQHSARRSVTVFWLRRDAQQRLKLELVPRPRSSTAAWHWSVALVFWKSPQASCQEKPWEDSSVI